MGAADASPRRAYRPVSPEGSVLLQPDGSKRDLHQGTLVVREIRGTLWSPRGDTTDSLVSRQRVDERGTEPRMANLPHGMGRARVVRAHVSGPAGPSPLPHCAEVQHV